MVGKPKRKKTQEESILGKVVDELCRAESYTTVYHRPSHGVSMPSIEALTEVVERLRAVLFPGYFLESEVTPATMPFSIGSNLDKVQRLLAE